MMFIYTALAALLGIVGGILLAACTKRSKEVTYGVLDKVGIATNIVLIPVYVCCSPLYLIIGMISEPRGEGFLWVLSLLVCLITASAAVFCSLGLGASVALRKKGKRVLSFAVQFAGLVGIGLTVLLYCVCVGSLISPLN